MDQIVRHWENMSRVAVSIHSGVVSAHEVTRIISGSVRLGGGALRRHRRGLSAIVARAHPEEMNRWP
ncbi:MAG: Tn3 family transposase [Pseudonocardiaceae bacterium]